MQKQAFVQAIYDADIAYIYYVSPKSKKEKYVIGTLDTKTPYIANKLAGKRNAIMPEGFVQVFCFDLDDFKRIDVSQVTKIVPLNQVVKN